MKYRLLEPTKVTGNRRDGNSTRQIDLAIQLLFEGIPILVEDHWMQGTHREANRNLFGRIMDRMRFEHQSTPIFFDKKRLIISLNEEDLKRNNFPNHE